MSFFFYSLFKNVANHHVLKISETIVNNMNTAQIVFSPNPSFTNTITPTVSNLFFCLGKGTGKTVLDQPVNLSLQSSPTCLLNTNLLVTGWTHSFLVFIGTVSLLPWMATPSVICL